MPEPEPIPVNDGGVAVLSGYGVRVKVERGHLALSDGIADERRADLLNRATAGLRHLVILGHTGSITVDALKWLHGLGAAVSMIDADGGVIFATAPLGLDNAHLRRAQALAPYTDAGLETMRALLTAKVAGQARVLRQLGRDDTADHLGAALDTLDGAATLDELRQVEAYAADTYWQAWADVPTRFARKDEAKVPEHWKRFGLRGANRWRKARNATSPGNALLNYLYAILETETRIALLAVGLDPGLGLLHADQPGRDSLVLDVMEPVRPDVDAWLFAFLRDRAFGKSNFFERHDGVCRLTTKLARELCATAPLWRRLVAPVAEKVAHDLAAAHKPGMRLATNLTGANRSAARQREKARRVAAQEAQAEPTEAGEDQTAHPVLSDAPSAAAARPRMAPACPECGKPVADRKRKFCSPECADAHQRATGPSALARERSHGGDVGRKRGESNARRAAERAEWEQAHPDVDPDAARKRFLREILPRLAPVPLSKIQTALGCSLRYASLIRRGEYVPHPMHHARLVELLAADGNR